MQVQNWQSKTRTRGGLKHWLQAGGSLSARLARLGGAFSVQVLNQGCQPLTIDEAAALGESTRRVGYVREVVLFANGQPMVFARSVTAFAHSVGPWRSVRGLGTRPLADVLFKRSAILRQPLQYSVLQRQSPMQQHVCRAWLSATGQHSELGALPARRSVFKRHAAALLVMEVFVAPSSQWPRHSGFAMRASKLGSQL